MERSDVPDETNVISLQGWRERLTQLEAERPETQIEAAHVQNDVMPDVRHSIDRYCDGLLEQGDISPIERQRLTVALQTLLSLIPVVDNDIIEMVRSEMAAEQQIKKGSGPRIVSNREKVLWEQSAASRIPGFDLYEAHGRFFIHLADDPEEGIRFLPGVKKENFLYVPFWLGKGERFFFIVLQMFRYQHERNEQAREEAEQEQSRLYMEWQSHPLWYRLMHKAP